MKSYFDFKNLLKRMTNISIPKEVIYFSIGTVLVVLIGLIASNMHLQEMLLFEGVEKSIPLFTEEELREYGDIYKEMSLDFQDEIGAYCQGYANRTNRAGEKIYYGIYSKEPLEYNRSKIYSHSNGQNINKADDDHISDFDDSYNDFPLAIDEGETYIENNEFKNGVNIKYKKTAKREEGESNYQDILTVISMLLDQKGTKDGSSEDNINIKEKVPELLRKLFKMSHTYRGETTELYPCEKGCRVLFYYCNEEDSKYKGTGIDLNPFSVNPNDELEDYFEEDFELKIPDGECEICGHNGKGCIVDSEKCYHGSEDVDTGCKHTMNSEGDCSNCEAHYICKDEVDGEHDCSDNPIGCGGHYDCMGHEHYNCPGHFYVCCMGHTDLIVNIDIMYIDELVKVVNNIIGDEDGE